MYHKFQGIRAALAKLIGNPAISETIASELDTALLADEATVGAKLAEYTNKGEEHSETAETVTTTAVEITAKVADAVTAVITAEETVVSPTALEAILTEMKGIRLGMTALSTENAKLKAENESLSAIRNAQSPRGVFTGSENGHTSVAKGRNKNADKDEADKAEFERLAASYPSLMSDLVQE